MPDRETHLVQAQRFEAFLRQIDRPDQTYKEWIVIVWFHIALHYVDAVLAEKKHWHQIESHADRTAKMHNCEETRAIYETYHQLYVEVKEARYQGTAFSSADLAAVKPHYEGVRAAMRKALRLDKA